MGHVTHHAIIVTTNDAFPGLATEARGVAIGLGLSVTDILDPKMNGYQTFLVGPDGSKEGWDESNQGDARRDQFKDYLRSKRYSDCSSPIEWVEVRYGSDDWGNDERPAVVDDEWADQI